MPMALIDNFTLQSIAELLDEGPTDDQSVWPRIDRDQDRHHWDPVNVTAFRLHALFDLAVQVVTRDQLVLCNDYRHVWDGKTDQLRHLEDAGIITSRDFDAHNEQAMALKARVVEECSATSSIRRKHAENVEGFHAHGRSPNAFLGTILWGTAGNFARAHQAECAYAPHPWRGSFLKQTVWDGQDATRYTLDWVGDVRLKQSAAPARSSNKHLLQILLSPIVVQLIEANDLGIEGLLPAALELRQDYAPLRRWLDDYQSTLDAEDLKGKRRHEDVLRAVEGRIAGTPREADFGSTSVGTGSLLPVPLSARIPIPKKGLIRHRVGVHALLNRMVFTPRGESSLKKLLRSMEATPTITQAVLQHFRRPH